VTEIIWSRQAIEDVEAIRAYVARDSARYADLLVERLVSAVEGLETDPLSGRVVSEVGDDTVREVIHGNYRIVYRVRPNLVEIVTVYSMEPVCFDCGELVSSERRTSGFSGRRSRSAEPARSSDRESLTSPSLTIRECQAQGGITT
jgi:addiction module RelE/StbE family toxin